MTDSFNAEKITFVIVTHNSENFISKCISSILSQTHKNFQILVIDNDSKDSTLDILTSFRNNSKIKIITNSNNIGYGNAVNQNLKNISSPFMAVVNADVFFEKNWARNLIKPLLNDDLIVLSSGMILFPDGLIQSAGGCMDKYGAVIHNKLLLKKINFLTNSFPFFYADGSAFLIRTDFFKNYSFDPNLFLYYEDVDLSWRIHMLKKKLLFVSDAIAYHDIGHKNKEMTTKKFLYTARNRLYVCQKNLPSKKVFKIIPSILFLLLVNSIYYNFKFKTVSYTFNFFKAWFWNIKNIKIILFQRKKVFKINLLTNDEFNNLITSKSIEINFFKNKILFKPK